MNDLEAALAAAAAAAVRARSSERALGSTPSHRALYDANTGELRTKAAFPPRGGSFSRGGGNYGYRVSFH